VNLSIRAKGGEGKYCRGRAGGGRAVGELGAEEGAKDEIGFWGKKKVCYQVSPRRRRAGGKNAVRACEDGYSFDEGCR